jgi:hypothetical protein
VKISRADKHIFEAVMAYYEMDAEEIELAREGYRNDPDVARVTYETLFREIPAKPDTLPWVKLSQPATTGKLKRA